MAHESATVGLTVHGLITLLVGAGLTFINVTLAPEFPWSAFAVGGMLIGLLAHYWFGYVKLDDQLTRQQQEVRRPERLPVLDRRLRARVGGPRVLRGVHVAAEGPAEPVPGTTGHRSSGAERAATGLMSSHARQIEGEPDSGGDEALDDAVERDGMKTVADPRQSGQEAVRRGCDDHEGQQRCGQDALPQRLAGRPGPEVGDDRPEHDAQTDHPRGVLRPLEPRQRAEVLAKHGDVQHPPALRRG